jgi:hypothetical protein
MKYIIFGLFIFFTCLYGCSNSECVESRETIVKLKNNIELLQIISDCKKGQVLLEQEFLRISSDSSIPNGQYKEYYQNGKLKISGRYEMGLQEGKFLYYSPNGQLEAQDFAVQGKLYGPQRKYYKNGKLKSIRYRKSDSINWFGIDMDQNGKYIKSEGRPIKINSKPGYKSRKVNDEIIAIIEVPVISDFTTELHLNLQNNGTVFYDTVVSKFEHDNEGNFDYFPLVKELNKQGSQVHLFEVKIIDNVTQKVVVHDRVIDTIIVN